MDPMGYNFEKRVFSALEIPTNGYPKKYPKNAWFFFKLVFQNMAILGLPSID